MRRLLTQKAPIHQNTLKSNDLIELSATLGGGNVASSNQAVQKQSVGTNIKGSTIKIDVTNHASIVGVVDGKVVDVTSKSLEVKAGVDSYHQKSSNDVCGGQIGVKIDRTLKGGVNVSDSEDKASAVEFKASVISGSDKLRIDTKNHIALSGSIVNGGEVALKSKSLAVETLKNESNSTTQGNQIRR